MFGRSEVEEGPDVWVPHVIGLREEKIRGMRVISPPFLVWNRDLARHVGQKGKCVGKTSLWWQICKLNSKSDF
jgi:hypothetical protein